MKKDRYLWYLYDFANSIALISVLYYFSLWAVVQNGMSQWIVSVPISLSTLVLLFVMPSIARRVDQKQTHKKVMLSFSVLAALCMLVLSFLKSSVYLPYFVFTIYFLFYFCYNSGYVFFTSFIQTVSDEKNRVATSGFGQMWGQLGNLVGVTLSFATTGFALFGIIGVQQVFLWASIVFLVLLIPMWWFRKNPVAEVRIETDEPQVRLSTFRKIYQNKKAFWFLMSYIFYADSMMTISFFTTLYLSKAVGLSADAIKIAGISMLIGTIVGALLTAALRKRGQLVSLKNILFIWPVLILATAFVSGKGAVLALLFFTGIVFSMIFAISRSFYSTIVPVAERAEFFSVYVIFERMGAIVGPIIWSATISIFMFLGESVAYRIAMGVTALITIGSIIMLKKVERID